MSETQTLLNNRFAVLRVQSVNNFNKVLFALDTYQNPARNCAIEVYKPTVLKPKIDEWNAHEFQKQASHLKQLSLINRHLPEIYTYFYDFSACYLVRELVEGITLKEKVVTGGKFSPRAVRKILVQLLSVLDCLHRERITHQNIQPKNIILRRSDNVPMLINFGSIKQIVTTFNFYGSKKVVSLKDALGYTPSEQDLGKPIPASDLYSLGLTAIYLLAIQNPIDLSIDFNRGSYQIPSEIKKRDSELAEILIRATNLNPSDRFSSAREMLDALLQTQPKTFLDRHQKTRSKRILSQKTSKIKSKPKWGMILICLMGCISLIHISLIAWQAWNSTQDKFVFQIPNSPLSLPSTLSELPQEPPREKPSITKKPSMLNNKSPDMLEIPIFATGTQKQQLREVLGEPNAIQKGYWANSSAWIYKDRAKGSIDLGYLFDRDTDKLQQTEIAIAPAVGLETIADILESLLQGNITQPVARELQKIYEGQIDVYSFKSGNLEGTIERDEDDNIYIGVWEADFH